MRFKTLYASISAVNTSRLINLPLKNIDFLYMHIFCCCSKSIFKGCTFIVEAVTAIDTKNKEKVQTEK